MQWKCRCERVLGRISHRRCLACHSPRVERKVELVVGGLDLCPELRMAVRDAGMASSTSSSAASAHERPESPNPTIPTNLTRLAPSAGPVLAGTSSGLGSCPMPEGRDRRRPVRSSSPRPRRPCRPNDTCPDCRSVRLATTWMITISKYPWRRLKRKAARYMSMNLPLRALSGTAVGTCGIRTIELPRRRSLWQAVVVPVVTAEDRVVVAAVLAVLVAVGRQIFLAQAGRCC